MELERRIPNKSYIIGLTAHATNVYKEKCFQSGMDEFSMYYFLLYCIVSKPFEVEKMRELLQRLNMI